MNNNIGSILTTVILVIAGVYLLNLGPATQEFLLRLFHIPAWHEASVTVNLVIRGFYLLAIVIVIDSIFRRKPDE